MGLHKTVVKYFFLNNIVVHMIINRSLMDRAYMWLNMTWLGLGNGVVSGFIVQCSVCILE